MFLSKLFGIFSRKKSDSKVGPSPTAPGGPTIPTAGTVVGAGVGSTQPSPSASNVASSFDNDDTVSPVASADVTPPQPEQPESPVPEVPPATPPEPLPTPGEPQLAEPPTPGGGETPAPAPTPPESPQPPTPGSDDQPAAT